MGGLARQRLIERTQFIAKAPRQRIVGHDAETHLAADQHKRRGDSAAGGEQILARC